MTRYIFRGCQRCGGDLYLNNDEQRQEQDDWQCLQCGRYRHRKPPQPGVNDFWAAWLSQAAASQPDRRAERAE